MNIQVWAFLNTLVILALGGCTGVIYLEDDQFVIEAIGLLGTTQADCTVTAEGVPDSDGKNNQQWQVDFTLDGANKADSLPEDNHEDREIEIEVKAINPQDSKIFYKKITVTLIDNPVFEAR